MNIIVHAAPALGLLAALVIYARLVRRPPGDERMQQIAHLIYQGTTAYLRRQYAVLAFFVAIVAVLLWSVRHDARIARVVFGDPMSLPTSAALV